MSEVSAETVIAMPRPEVWAKLRNLLAARNYVPGVTDIQFNSSQHEGIGASRKVFIKGRSPVDETAITWEEGRGYTLKLHNGDKPPTPFKRAEFRYEILDEPGGATRVRLVMSYDVQGGILGRLFDLLVLRRAVRQTNDVLGPNMKTFYETGRATNAEAA